MDVDKKASQKVDNRVSLSSYGKLFFAATLVAGGLMLPCLPGAMIGFSGVYLGAREFFPSLTSKENGNQLSRRNGA